MRGDPCWRDLTCLNYHYETQPMPGPLSWFFHWAPAWFHQGGVLFNHFSELVVPFAYFLPQPVAAIAGAITIAFQGLIFAGGNLSWLNALTMVLAVSTFDDRVPRAAASHSRARDRAARAGPSAGNHRARASWWRFSASNLSATCCLPRR